MRAVEKDVWKLVAIGCRDNAHRLLSIDLYRLLNEEIWDSLNHIAQHNTYDTIKQISSGERVWP